MKRQKKLSSTLLFRFQTILTVLGIVFSIQLLFQHTQLKSGIQESASFCSINKYADCDVVNASAYSEILGIPTATIGAIYFFLFLLMQITASPSRSSYSSMQQWMGRICLLGLGVDLYLLLVSIVELNTICLLCAATYLFNAGILATVLLGSHGGIRSLLTLWGPIPAIGKSHWLCGLLCWASFSTALFLLPSAIWMKSQFYAFVDNAVSQFYEKWKEQPGSEIPIGSKDAVFGNPNAKVQLVVFSDFECPHCKKAAFTLQTSVKPFEKEVLLVFKHFPLDSSCNNALSYQLHPMACRLAQLSYCANRDGNFWKFHDKIYFELAKNGKLPDWKTLTRSLSGIFQREATNECLNDKEALEHVLADIELGNQLKVSSTPSIFVNGKKVTIPLTVSTLTQLIQLELDS